MSWRRNVALWCLTQAQQETAGEMGVEEEATIVFPLLCWDSSTGRHLCGVKAITRYSTSAPQWNINAVTVPVEFATWCTLSRSSSPEGPSGSGGAGSGRVNGCKSSPDDPPSSSGTLKHSKRSKSKDRSKSEPKMRTAISGYWSSDDTLDRDACLYHHHHGGRGLPSGVMTMGRHPDKSQSQYFMESYNTISAHSLKTSRSNNDVKCTTCSAGSSGSIPLVAGSMDGPVQLKKSSWSSTLTVSRAREVYQKASVNLDKALVKAEQGRTCHFLQVGPSQQPRLSMHPHHASVFVQWDQKASSYHRVQTCLHGNVCTGTCHYCIRFTVPSFWAVSLFSLSPHVCHSQTLCMRFSLTNAIFLHLFACEKLQEPLILASLTTEDKQGTILPTSLSFILLRVPFHRCLRMTGVVSLRWGKMMRYLAGGCAAAVTSKPWQKKTAAIRTAVPNPRPRSRQDGPATWRPRSRPSRRWPRSSECVWEQRWYFRLQATVIWILITLFPNCRQEDESGKNLQRSRLLFGPQHNSLCPWISGGERF